MFENNYHLQCLYCTWSARKWSIDFFGDKIVTIIKLVKGDINLMKKLTIGSMKYDPNASIATITEPNQNQSAESTETKKRMMEIEQDHIHYQLEVKSDQSILEASFEQGISLNYKCQKGTCGKCKVMIVNGRSNLHQANQLEENKLKELLQRGFRLACQARAK